MSDTSWSLGVLVGLPILILTVLVLIVVGVWLFRRGSELTARDERLFLKWSAGATLATAFATVVLALTPVGFYPFSAEYHQWRPVDGTVQRIDSRLIQGDKATETKFVVRFDGNGQQYGCDDTRCAGVGVGDHLSLSCKRAWQFTGTDGYDCRFVNVEAS